MWSRVRLATESKLFSVVTSMSWSLSHHHENAIEFVSGFSSLPNISLSNVEYVKSLLSSSWSISFFLADLSFYHLCFLIDSSEISIFLIFQELKLEPLLSSSNSINFWKSLLSWIGEGMPPLDIELTIENPQSAQIKALTRSVKELFFEWFREMFMISVNETSFGLSFCCVDKIWYTMCSMSARLCIQSLPGSLPCNAIWSCSTAALWADSLMFHCFLFRTPF